MALCKLQQIKIQQEDRASRSYRRLPKNRAVVIHVRYRHQRVGSSIRNNRLYIVYLLIYFHLIESNDITRIVNIDSVRFLIVDDIYEIESGTAARSTGRRSHPDRIDPNCIWARRERRCSDEINGLEKHTHATTRGILTIDTSDLRALAGRETRIVLQ